MTKEETVSIVVPVYNAQAYLADTVRMVQSQTYENWELLLVDDHSDDGCLELMERAARQDGRIRVLCQREGIKGAANARNLGTMQARGDYLAFLDADDLWKPDKLERQLAFMREKEAAFSFTAYEFGDEEGRGTGKIVHVPTCLDYRRALSRTVIFTSTVLLDRRKLPGTLLLMPDIKSEDTATWWQILRAGYRAWGLDQVLTVYRRAKKTLSSNKIAAIARIWRLYRRQEGLSVISSARYFCFWALRATLRRI